jgi:hypothetical protein
MMLSVTHTEQNGQLAPVEFRMRVKHPLVSDARVEPWVAALVGACDGSHSGIELFRDLKEQEVINEEMSADEFVGVLRLLLESGFLEIDEFRLPGEQMKAFETSAAGVH